MQFYTVIAAFATFAAADYQPYNPSVAATAAAAAADFPNYAAPAQTLLAGAQVTDLYSGGKSSSIAIAVVATVATLLF
ncbi:hypothetical protein HDU77_010637 [Chytriomyces hyalinus]|nr:hypothetical protein HDU77_010637 [Chytriomyces hyalinus]KAJ3407490.1 hypothetical protein HDU80_008547 [Chytriomyces hyalinus]